MLLARRWRWIDKVSPMAVLYVVGLLVANLTPWLHDSQLLATNNLVGNICIPLAIPDMHVLSGIAAQGKVLSELAFIILLATFAVYLLMPVGQRNL